MSSSKPLAGFTVVEIGHSIAAPYAGMVLAGLGAEVIKVESPGGGDYARGWGPPFWDGAAPHFVAMNRNKRSITVDMGDAAQRERLERLILDEADAVLCNLRPGSADKHGLGAAQLLARKPSLVYADIGAFGRGGPLSDLPGYDPLMQAFGGLMSITGEAEGRPPIRVGVSMIDMGAGLWAAIGVMGALIERQRTGYGGRVETSLYETALAWTAIPIASVLINPRVMKPQGSGASGIVPYQAFLASDGWIVIGAGNDNLFRKLCRALERPELESDPRFTTNADRVRNRDILIPLIEPDIARRNTAEVRALLDAAGVPNAPVQRIDQVVHEPHAKALGIIQDGPDGALPTVGLPLRFDGERPNYERAAPRLGQHDSSIMSAEIAGD